MTLSTALSTAASRIALWAARNPTAVRLALIALPLAAAVAAAVLNFAPVSACPPLAGPGGCGD